MRCVLYTHQYPDQLSENMVVSPDAVRVDDQADRQLRPDTNAAI
jgi:hypothetical protein